MGIRYFKLKDKSMSEDHFLFERGNENVITGKGNKKWLEKLCPEYKGSHKARIELNEEKLREILVKMAVNQRFNKWIDNVPEN